MTNAISEHLFGLNKEALDKTIVLPNPNEAITIEIFPKDPKYRTEKFLVDINRKYLQLSKKTFQKRVRTSVVLRRIDFNGGHLNPEINYLPEYLEPKIIELMKKYERKRFANETHMHTYIEGYGERWAFPINEFSIISGTNFIDITKDFLKYCNVSPVPTIIQKDLLCYP